MLKNLKITLKVMNIKGSSEANPMNIMQCQPQNLDISYLSTGKNTE